MLSKFVAIKNVGRFEDCRAEGQVNLGRYTLVYAGNGRGKTTLCSILRSLQCGDAGPIIGRKTLAGIGAQDIQILTPSGVKAFDGTAWSATEPNIAIFDQAFIASNVFSGEVVSLENRRNLYRVVLGAAGVTLASRLEQLDSDSRNAATEIRDSEAQVKGLSRAADVDAFVGLQQEPDIDAKISEREAEESALSQAETVRKTSALSAFKPSAFFADLSPVLSATVEQLTEAAIADVKKHIDAHKMGAAGEQWIAQGLLFDAKSTCPFCAQDIAPASGHITAFKAYFGKAYKDLQSLVQRHFTELEKTFGEQAITALGTVVRNNDVAMAFWKGLVRGSLKEVDWAQHFDSMRSLRDNTKRLLQQKQQAPLTVVPIDASHAAALEQFNKLNDVIEQYNLSVTAVNAEIAAIKTSTAAGDITKVRTELATLRLRKLRFEPDTVSACNLYSAAKAKKAAIGAEKDKAKEALETHAGDTFKTHQASINRILSDVQAGFMLADAQVEYPAGTPSTRYRIVINGEAVSLGDSDTPDTEPSFRNTLSAGDRSVLALALFVSQLQHDPAVTDKIVVFDDPFSSQDSFRRDLTIRLIRECGEKARQVIILSHDREFLRRLWNRLADKGTDRKTLELRRVGPRNTTICSLDIEDATDEWVQNRQALVDFYMAGQGDDRDVVQKIRPALETYLRVVGAPLILATDNLGVIATKASANGCTHSIAAQATEITDLNFYTNRYMHGQNPNWRTEPIDPHELQSMVYRTLQLMGGS